MTFIIKKFINLNLVNYIIENINPLSSHINQMNYDKKSVFNL